MRTNFKLAIALCIGATLAGCATTRPTAVDFGDVSTATGFINMITVAGDMEQPCVLYVPRDYDPKQEWPLVVFLHGVGECGNDGIRHTEVGIGKAIRRNPKRFPCLVLFPQCPKDYVWEEVYPGWADGAGNALPFVDDAIAQVLAHYSIDRDRISLTGLSMGGFGTFVYGAQRIDTFSALMPICGGGRVEEAGTLARLPMWVFHGADDTVVPPRLSREMVDAIKAAGGDIQYTEFPDTDHNSWDKAYGKRQAIEWLLEQRRD